MSMIRVAPTCTLNFSRREKMSENKVHLLTDEGPWAVVVAEGLESFWTLRKGEGCLGGTGPDTAAIGWVEMGRGPISMEESCG
jgi:hypothetical protein